MKANVQLDSTYSVAPNAVHEEVITSPADASTEPTEDVDSAAYLEVWSSKNISYNL